MTTEKVAEEIGNCIRANIAWNMLPAHLRTLLHDNQRDYEKYVFNYCLKNQLRFRGNLVSKVFRREQRYYELLVQKNINGLGIFPYHLADIITKGLRVTPFNYYLEVLSQLLKNDKSYDTLPNFTAADCLRVLGIGRNEYLALISDLKTNTTRSLLFSNKPNPERFLPNLPKRIRIEPWWRLDIGYVLETDIRYVTPAERALLDDLIDFGALQAGKCDYNAVHSLYRKGLIFLDVPICSEDRICIPPLRNFVMNRVSGDYFENLLYKIFVSADELMTIMELAQMLQVDLESVKQAVSLFCRLGFAERKKPLIEQDEHYHASWVAYSKEELPQSPQITPLNYNTFQQQQQQQQQHQQQQHKNQRASPVEMRQRRKEQDALSIGCASSDGNVSDASYQNAQNAQNALTPSADTTLTSDGNSSTPDELSERTTKLLTPTPTTPQTPTERTGKRLGFLFDSTLTAFLMMGNLSPGLKNHAVTMFEVGKLSEESMDSFLAELEKVSLLDAEGEGDVSRYFAHAIILRSTICSLRHLLPGGLDLLRLECLGSLDQQTRDRVLEKKYKYIISATPLTAQLTYTFSIPFFGQYYRSSDTAQLWTKLFYNHITGYGPPSLLLCQGTVLKTMPRHFLGYGKLLVNVLHSDAYVINSENFRNLNEQLKNGCVLIQGYGIRQPGLLHYESFPFERKDTRQMVKWSSHNAVKKLAQLLDLKHHCGYITFLNTGVPDIGCEDYELRVTLRRQQRKKSLANAATATDATAAAAAAPKHASVDVPKSNEIVELTSFARATVDAGNSAKFDLVSQSSVEIPLSNETTAPVAACSLVAQQQQQEACNESGIKAAEHSEDSTEEWTILDVNFGVPLFDVDCNTRICEQLVRELCTQENLAQLPVQANAMRALFIAFIEQCMRFEDEPDSDKFQLNAQKDALPQPRINLAFENGRVCYWTGR